ncbi:MAG: hypothetical protein AAF434_07725 [Pseudomonadota bacterium]
MKFLSSIFSSETLRLKDVGVSPLTGGFLVCLLLLAIAEVGMRAVLPESHKPRGSWHNLELRDQAEQLREMKDVDVMFAGSSIAAVNIPPVAFDSAASELGYELDSFNAGIRGCNYSCIAAGFKHMFLPLQEPKKVILIVAPVDLNEANESVIRRSEDFIRTFNNESYVAALIDVFRHLYVFGFRAEIKDFIVSQKWNFEPSLIGEKGHIDMGYEPRNRYQYKFRFEEKGRIVKDLSRMIDDLQSRGIKVAILPGLVDGSIREMMSKEETDEFAIILSKLAKKHEIELYRADDLVPDDEKFIDQFHLNTGAAHKYAASLAEKIYKQ